MSIYNSETIVLNLRINVGRSMQPGHLNEVEGESVYLGRTIKGTRI